MDIYKDWKQIRRVVNKSIGSSLHASIATVDANNRPNIAPIGSLILLSNQQGIYFEKFTSSIPSNAKHNTSVCVLAVNSGLFFWFKSLLFGKFKECPGLRLYGELGETRKATDVELSRWHKRIKAFRKLKGYKCLWKDMTVVREIKFTTVSVLNLGKMTSDL